MSFSVTKKQVAQTTAFAFIFPLMKDTVWCINDFVAGFILVYSQKPLFKLFITLRIF